MTKKQYKAWKERRRRENSNETIKAERQRKELERNKRIREDLEEMGFIFPKKEDN